MNRGRPREFAKEDALAKAMILFWRNGYRGVSLDDLTDAMEITRPSLYSAFGDKEALFLQAVDYYRNTVIMPVFRELLAARGLRDGLSDFIKSMCKLMASRETPGCFIACMLVQDSCYSPSIKDKLASLIDGADRGFITVFSEHRIQLKKSYEPESAAKLLTSVLHGLAIRARSGASARELTMIGESFIEAVCKPS